MVWRLALVAGPLAVAAVPAQMRAGALTKKPWDLKVHLEDFGVVRAGVPVPKHGEVLIQVAGASINPCEWKQFEWPYAWTLTYPHIGGHDLGGTVVAVGEGTTRLKVGDKVWALSAGEGAHAEYAVVPEVTAALAPTRIPLQEASTLPLVALTNLEAYRKAGGPWQGRGLTVVVLGGSGGTGHTAIQMARAWGAAKVITTCGTSNLEFCRSMGADEVIDYHTQEWYKVLEPQSVDFIYDTVALNGTGDLAYPVIRDGGFFITLLSQGLASKAVASQRPSIQQSFFLLDQYSHVELDMLREIAEAGGLKVHIDKTFGLEDIVQVFNSSLSGHTVGKVLVRPSSYLSELV